ncbi:MAG: hypothetical protein JJE52_08665 [Acidimicrobiia bacterium]|nr:hypothetical protein [Acidimicrobiia bacterium]
MPERAGSPNLARSPPNALDLSMTHPLPHPEGAGTAVVDDPEPPGMPPPTDPGQGLDRWTAACWVLLGLVTTWMLWQVIKFDFRTEPLVGDQASSYMQMLSLAHDGHDLSFNSLDYAHWEVIEWMRQPYGLYFQAFEGGWAFAKPYGYSLLLVVPYRVFGFIVGVAFTNAVLLLSLVGVSIAILRLRLRGPAVPLLTGAFVFASNAYFHAFPVVVDLFLAVLMGACAFLLVFGLKRGHLLAQVAGFGAFAFLFAEKTTLLVAVGPLAAFCLWQARGWWRRLAMVGGFVVVLGVAVLPYLHYSDGASWNAYGGERYYGRTGVPFGPDGVGELNRVDTDETLSIGYIVDSLQTNIDDAVESAAYYAVGQHTGLLVCFPIALFVMVLALARSIRRWMGHATAQMTTGADAGRVGDDVAHHGARIVPDGGDGRSIRPEAAAALLGLGLYIALYLVLFPHNFYGGGQAIGNRYFLQVSPLVLVVAAGARIPSRQLVGASLAAISVSLVLWWPHHETPQQALIDQERTTPVQEILPWEGNQSGVNYWICGFAICDDIDD